MGIDKIEEEKVKKNLWLKRVEWFGMLRVGGWIMVGNLDMSKNQFIKKEGNRNGKTDGMTN